jgi:hypothetical protein
MCVARREKAVAESAIRGIKISDESRIAKYPVYVGWVPTRNIYASVAALDIRLERIERLMEALLAK